MPTVDDVTTMNIAATATPIPVKRVRRPPRRSTTKSPPMRPMSVPPVKRMRPTPTCRSDLIHEEDRAPIEWRPFDHHRGGSGKHQPDCEPARPFANPGPHRRRGHHARCEEHDQESHHRSDRQLGTEPDVGAHCQSGDPGAEKSPQAPHPMKAGHDRSPDLLLHPHPDRVHPNVGLGVQESEHAQHHGQPGHRGHDSDQREQGKEEDRSQHRRRLRPEASQDHPAQRGAR